MKNILSVLTFFVILNESLSISSLLYECRVEHTQLCHQRDDPVRCLTENRHILPEGRCKSWVLGRYECFEAVSKSDYCERQRESKRECLARIPSEELPSSCTISEFYKVTAADFAFHSG